MGINSYKFSQLFQWLQFICTKQMHEFIFYSYFFSAINKFLIGKMSLKNKFENQKPDFGFKTENRISGFRLTSVSKTASYNVTVIHCFNVDPTSGMISPHIYAMNLTCIPLKSY